MNDHDHMAEAQDDVLAKLQLNRCPNLVHDYVKRVLKV